MITFLILIIFLHTISLCAQRSVTSALQEISKDSTFDFVTWNNKWFGSESFGPKDLEFQLNNVLEVIRAIDADLYAFQEIVDKPRYFALRDSLEEYSGFYSNYSQSQKTAYLFHTSVIDSLVTGLLEAQQNEED